MHNTSNRLTTSIEDSTESADTQKILPFKDWTASLRAKDRYQKKAKIKIASKPSSVVTQPQSKNFGLMMQSIDNLLSNAKNGRIEKMKELI